LPAPDDGRLGVLVRARAGPAAFDRRESAEQLLRVQAMVVGEEPAHAESGDEQSTGVDAEPALEVGHQHLPAERSKRIGASVAEVARRRLDANGGAVWRRSRDLEAPRSKRRGSAPVRPALALGARVATDPTPMMKGALRLSRANAGLAALVLGVGCSRGAPAGGAGGASAGGIGGTSMGGAAGPSTGGTVGASTGGTAGPSTGGTGGDAPSLGHGLIFDNGGRTNYPSIERCDASGGCSPGQVCFHLTSDIGLCDSPQPPTSTMCTMGGFGGNPPDECSCDGGVCGTGQICINWQDDGSTGVFSSHNICVAPACTSPSDCAAGTVCTPSSFILARNAPCTPLLCSSDADCTDGSDGRCSLILQTPPQNGRVHVVAIRCVYRGTFDVSAPDPSLCAGTTPRMTALRDPPPLDNGFYYCPQLTR
jgi:hypothetical protein